MTNIKTKKNSIAVNAFTQDAEQHDDITMISFRINQ